MVAPVASQGENPAAENTVHQDGVEIQHEADGDAEDVDPVKRATDPGQPTAADVESHRCDHYPYRSWCKWCVMGRGLGTPHRSRGEESRIPRIGVDYFFITRGGVRKHDELTLDGGPGPPSDELTEQARKDGEIIKCVIVRDWETKSIFGHCVPCKGADEEDYVAGLVAEDVAWLGHTKVLLKGDNERALRAMMARAIAIIKTNGGTAETDDATPVEQVGLEEPPTYDSQANGGTERGVRSIRGLFRTLK